MLSMKSKLGGGSFPWPTPIQHTFHKAMSKSLGEIQKAISIGVSGATDGSELRLVHSAPQNVSIDRVNAAGAVVWFKTALDIRAGVTSAEYLLCSYYDSAEGVIYTLTGVGNGNDMFLDKINIVNGSITHLGGVITLSGFANVATYSGQMKIMRMLPGEGNLIVFKHEAGVNKKLELNPATGAVAAAPIILATPNGVSSEINSGLAIGYVSADGVYHFCHSTFANYGNSIIYAGKNGFTVGIKFGIEGLNVICGSRVEAVMVDSNTVAVCATDFGTRYYARTDFDKWLKTIVDAQGL